ncbi:hypothetical protein NMY22_g10303 [Coprinellus aureogranulatus]|nr:hypothetical protein NMY22_g10303 [Coprinellus aureogranulatus]
MRTCERRVRRRGESASCLGGEDYPRGNLPSEATPQRNLGRRAGSPREADEWTRARKYRHEILVRVDRRPDRAERDAAALADVVESGTEGYGNVDGVFTNRELGQESSIVAKTEDEIVGDAEYGTRELTRGEGEPDEGQEAWEHLMRVEDEETSEASDSDSNDEEGDRELRSSAR